MFKYNVEERTFDKIIGAWVRRDDMVIIGKVVAVENVVDGYGHQNSTVIIDKYAAIDVPLLDENDKPYQIHTSIRNIAGVLPEVDTKTMIQYQVEPWEVDKSDKSTLKFTKPAEKINHFAPRMGSTNPPKKSKRNDFMDGISEVVEFKMEAK